jgi:predicted peroxiredoxin
MKRPTLSLNGALLVQRMVLALVLLVAALAVAPAVQADDPPRHFVFSVTTDESWTAGSALTQALVAARRGHRVTVLLSVRGIHLAEAESAQGGFRVTARSPREMLADLMADGHAVLVCGMCMVAGGVTQDELIKGAEISGPDRTFTALTAPNTIVLSY